MPKYEIKMSVDSKDAERNLDSTAKSFDKVTGSNKKLVEGLKQAGREIPILGTALSALRNPFTLAGAAIAFLISKMADYKRAAAEMVSNIGHANRPVEVHTEKLSSMAEALKAITEAQRDLKTATETTNTFLQGEIDLMEEQIEMHRELAAAKIEASMPDGPERKLKLQELDRQFGARRALRKGELIDQQIGAEQLLQREAAASVPAEADVRKAVGIFQQDRQNLAAAKGVNRAAFAKAEVLRRVTRPGASPFEFAPADQDYLVSLGILDPQSFRIDRERAGSMLPGAEAGERLAGERLGQAQGAFNMSRAALPRGVSSEQDIPGFLSAAESSAAETMTGSQARLEKLQAARGQVTRKEKHEGALFDIQRGGGNEGDAFVQRRADEIRRLSESNNARDQETLRLLQKMIQENETYVRWVKQMATHGKATSQDMR